MLKRILTVILIAICLVAFCGCGKVDFTYALTKNGVYQQIIDVTLDDNLSLTGYTRETAMAKLNQIFNGEKYNIITYPDNPNHIRAYKNFSSLDEMMKDYLGNGLANATPSTSSDFLFEYQTVSANAMLSIDYKTRYWLYIYSKYGITNFGIFELNDVDASYNFLTPYRSVSSNADVVEKQGDYYNHRWNVTEKVDYNVSMTMRTPRQVVWYALAIFASAITIASVCIISVSKNKSLKKNISDADSSLD
ncbi:MAG: hypothetical protein RR357_00905 [Clostridia bacterium]